MTWIGTLRLQVASQSAFRIREVRGTMARIKAGPLVKRLKKWLKDQGITRYKECMKKANGADPHCKCMFCPPLSTIRVQVWQEEDGSYKPISRQ